ncbi:MAG: hypothetical protein LPK02_07645 [Rhodobacterales bacterium]|nr:hypothetical protein [Rhodobacterales bacterium]
MSKVEYLNVDDIAPMVQKVVTIKGVQHPYHAPKVSDFLEEMKRIKSLQAKKKEELTEVDIIEMMVDSMRVSIKSSFPTITDEILDDLTYEQISAIQKFVTAQIEADSEEAEDSEGNG